MASPYRIPFFNLAFDNVRLADVFDAVERNVGSRSYGYMASVNVDMLVKSADCDFYRTALLDADLLLIDSTPLMKIGKIMGIPIKEKLAGSDLMPDVCEFAAERGLSVFVLGGKPGVPERAADNLKKAYPGLSVAGTLSPKLGFEHDSEALAEIVSEVRESGSDILFVCLNALKGEVLCGSLLDLTGVSYAFCVGAAVDFAAGSVKRAPSWVQEAGLEWLYRFAKEPRRLFRRYFVDSWRFAPLAFRSLVGDAHSD